MSLITTIVAAAEAEHELAPLWMPAPLFGVVMAGILLVLGLVTYSYRDVANRHSHKTGGDHHDGHGDAHGHGH